MILEYTSWHSLIQIEEINIELKASLEKLKEESTKKLELKSLELQKHLKEISAQNNQVDRQWMLDDFLLELTLLFVGFLLGCHKHEKETGN